jgi:hypothetical protein
MKSEMIVQKMTIRASSLAGRMADATLLMMLTVRT